MAQKTQLQLLEKQTAALSLALAGVDYQTIADKAGYNSRQAAWSAIRRMLKQEICPLVEEFRAMELRRLDMLQTAIWKDAMQGHLGAVDRVLRIMERRARLLGLDAPAKADVTSSGQPVKAYTVLASPDSWDELVSQSDQNGNGQPTKVYIGWSPDSWDTPPAAPANSVTNPAGSEQ